MSNNTKKLLNLTKPQTSFVLKIFDMSMLNPYKQNKYSMVYHIFLILGLVYVLLMHVMELTFNFDGLETVPKLRFTPLVVVLNCQFAFFVLAPERVLKPFELLKNLWQWDKFGPAVQKKLEATSNKCFLAMKIYVFMVCCNAFMMISEPYFQSTPELPYHQYDYCDMANNTICYHINFLIGTSTLVQCNVPVLLAFDILFLSIVVEVYNQFELLKMALENCEVGVDNHSAIKEIVEEHNAIISLVKELDSWMTWLFLAKLNAYTIQMISSAYMLTIKGMPPTVFDMKTYGVHFMTVVMMVYLYCHGGAVIFEQSLSVAESAYAMRWAAKGQTLLRKDLVFIIQVAQKPVLFTAGYMHLNMTAFVNAMQNVFSVYGLLATLAADEIIADE